jgi:acyl-CoA synthetase (AMP-forming)/AMP-acid ligase II
MFFRSDYPAEFIPDVPLHQHVLSHYEKNKDEILFIDNATKESLSVRDFATQIANISKNFRSLGYIKGDVGCICLPNHILYAGVFFGMSKAGVISTPMNPASTLSEMHHQLRDSGAKLIITLASLLDKCLTAAQQEGCVVERILVVDQKHVEETTTGAITIADISLLTKHSDAAEVQVTINPETDVLTLPYSSGTTGLAKGVQLTHKNLVAATVSLQATVQFTNKDVR